jgi:rhodanese-related sulfurtransferase
MRQRKLHALFGSLAIALAAAGCNAQPGGHDAKNATPAPAVTAAAPEVSGKLEGGLRIVTLDPAAPAPVVRVYRGDYVQMALTSGAPFTVAIDSLKLTWTWPVPEGGKPYLKMTESGRFPFQAGSLAGTLEVIDFQAAAYREVGAAEAAQVIANLKPFVLDVRTPGEFAEGHLEGATLLPIQEMQQRLGELASHKHDPVFVYCHSGNRSTVAAKLMVDAGFDQVINLRKGINDWKAAGLPLVR